MAFNINDFRTNLNGQKEVAKADKFDVTISIPNLSGLFNVGSTGESLSLVCEAAELPGVTITPIEWINYGFVQRIPGKLTFPPVSLTFICTGLMQERTFFDSWINSMIPFNSGLLVYPDDNNQQIKSNIAITQYSSTGTNIYTVNLLEAWPMDIQPLPLDWANDQVHRLSVTFSYKKWTSNGTTSTTNATPVTTQPNNLTNVEPPPVDFEFGGGGGFGGGGSSGSY